MALSFDDFTLRLAAGSGGSVQAQVLESPAGEGAGPVDTESLPPRWVSTVLGRLFRNLVPVEADHPHPQPPDLSPEEIGDSLYKAVFHGPVESLLESSLEIVQARQRGLRIKLLLDLSEPAIERFQALPWEGLYQSRTQHFLGLDQQISIVRSLAVPRPVREVSFQRPLRILAAYAQPPRSAELNLASELAALSEAVRPSWHVDRCRAVRSELRAQLHATSYQVLHFMGHGDFGKTSDDGVLIFEGSGNREDRVTGKDLATKLRDFPSLNLIVLNACEGAKLGPSRGGNPFAGVASALVLAGAPAVIAMQAPIFDSSAITFTTALYFGLANGQSIESAMTEARQALRDAGGSDWLTPVLFFRGRIADPPPPDPVAQGKKLLSDGDPHQALQTLRAALKDEPERLDARLYEAVAWLAASTPPTNRAAEELDRQFQVILRNPESEVHSMARLALGILRLDVFEPRRLRSSGVPDAEIIAVLQRYHPTAEERAIARCLRPSRDAILLFNLGH